MYPFLHPLRLFTPLFLAFFLILLLTMAFAPGVKADDDKTDEVSVDQDFLQAQLQRLDTRLTLERLQPTDLPGFYEALLNTGDLVYIRAEGDYLLLGNLIKFEPESITDLTQEGYYTLRQERIAALPLVEQVVFPAQGDTHAVIHIFTDITCPYCLRLHEEVEPLNAAGVEVRYLAFPRQGAGSSGYQQLVNVWCAEDTRTAMDRAKRGQPAPPADPACVHPVEHQLHLARSLGIQGTPAIILPKGRLLPGYLPAQRLLHELGL